MALTSWSRLGLVALTSWSRLDIVTPTSRSRLSLETLTSRILLGLGIIRLIYNPAFWHTFTPCILCFLINIYFWLIFAQDLFIDERYI